MQALKVYAMYDEKNDKIISGSYTQNSPFYMGEAGATKALKYNQRKGFVNGSEVIVEIEITKEMFKKIKI